uniref:Uncharacterized protein n=1 Tax=Arundo donax TaxID=35708 RepID=A0A0A9BFU7_ARUDO
MAEELGIIYHLAHVPSHFFNQKLHPWFQAMLDTPDENRRVSSHQCNNLILAEPAALQER